MDQLLKFMKDSWKKEIEQKERHEEENKKKALGKIHDEIKNIKWLSNKDLDEENKKA